MGRALLNCLFCCVRVPWVGGGAAHAMNSLQVPHTFCRLHCATFLGRLQTCVGGWVRLNANTLVLVYLHVRRVFLFFHICVSPCRCTALRTLSRSVHFWNRAQACGAPSFCRRQATGHAGFRCGNGRWATWRSLGARGGTRSISAFLVVSILHFRTIRHSSSDCLSMAERQESTAGADTKLRPLRSAPHSFSTMYLRFNISFLYRFHYRDRRRRKIFWHCSSDAFRCIFF